MNEFNSRILTNELAEHPDKMTFVVFNGKVGIGGAELSHETVALEMCCYDIAKSDEKLWVDDGGIIRVKNDLLIIDPYFSDGTRIRPLFENQTEDQLVIEKRVRQQTGQLIADCSGRKVLVLHTDNTQETFQPTRTDLVGLV